MKIYKFFSQNRIEQVLNDSMLRFTQPSEFNDPFEVRPYIEGLIDPEFVEKIMTKEVLDKLLAKIVQSEPEVDETLSNTELTSEQIQEIHKTAKSNIALITSLLNKKLYEKSNKEFGILSLASKFDNLIMWAHYANSHQGLVIEFKKNHLFFNQSYHKNNFLGTLQAVTYSKERPQDYLHDLDTQKMYLTKSDDWSYEKEYRMFLPLKDATEIQRETIYLFKFPVDMISAIYCGNNIFPENLEKILYLIDSKKELSHIQVYQTKLSQKFYALEFNQIR